MSKLGMKIAIIDHAKDKKLIDEFAVGYGNEFLNLGVEADLGMLFVLIKHARMVIANDTSFIHVAIALRVPSVCVVTNERMGGYNLYGYEDINKWAYNHFEPDIVPSVEAGEVIEICRKLMDHQKNTAGTREKFRLHYGAGYPYSSED